MIRTINIAFILFFFYSCAVNENEEPVVIEENEEVVIHRQIDLSAGGLPLGLIEVPGEEAEVSTVWNPTFGRMEVDLKPDVSIFIKQDTVSIASKIAEIESGVFEITYLAKTDSLIFYKTSLPGGIAPYWHFFASFPIDGMYYNFENNPIIECNQRQIEKMLGFVSRITQKSAE